MEEEKPWDYLEDVFVSNKPSCRAENAIDKLYTMEQNMRIEEYNNRIMHMRMKN